MQLTLNLDLLDIVAYIYSSSSPGGRDLNRGITVLRMTWDIGRSSVNINNIINLELELINCTF